MALYQYSVWLLRETAHGPLLADLTRAGLVRPYVHPHAAADDLELLGLPFMPSTGQRPEGISILELTPYIDRVFEELLATRGREFLDWLWTAVAQLGVLFAFVPVDTDFPYFADGRSAVVHQLERLGELLDTGAVRVAHPLMMFAARLGHGRPCARAATLNWPMSEARPGVGGLLVLATNETADGFELLAPGTMYPELIADFAERWSR